MPAPPSALITALRTGSVARHLLFSMTHSQGTVRAWDGVGDFSFGGNTYSGELGLAAISGISDSGDIQNHEILVTLNGVELPAWVITDPDIRDRVATITAVWLQEDGVVLASRVLAIAKGDVLRVKIDAGQLVLVAKLRGPLADWRTPPRAYYTDKDQQRRFPGDTGFRFVQSLENVSTSGWALTPGSTGGAPTVYGTLRGRDPGIRDNVDFAAIGDNSRGLTAMADAALTIRDADGDRYVDDFDLETIKQSASNDVLQDSGKDCVIDSAGDVRTHSNHRVRNVNNDNSRRLRRAGAISANGTATGTSIISGTLNGFTKLLQQGVTWSANLDDQTAIVFCNYNGNSVVVNANIPERQADGSDYVEDVTGAVATMASGTLQVGGVDCKVSTTGVILTTGGRRVVRQGGTAAEFLRIWT